MSAIALPANAGTHTAWSVGKNPVADFDGFILP
jgi:hypothetical protein